MNDQFKGLLEPCAGCGQQPIDVAPPQAKGKAQYQCQYYAAHDRANIQSACWGMLAPMSHLSAVDIWNGGEKYYRELFGLQPRVDSK